MAIRAPKPFPFTADQMRAQLPMKATVEDFDCWTPKKGMTVELKIGVVCGLPDQVILVPVDEWKAMIAWVAKHEKALAAGAGLD